MPHLYEVFRQRNVSVVLGGAADWVEPVLLRLESIAREEAPDYELYESECLTQLMTLLLTKNRNAAGMLRGKHSRNGNKFISIWKNTLQKKSHWRIWESVSV